MSGGQNAEPGWKRLLKSRLLLRPPVDTDPRLFGRTTKGIVLFSAALCACSSGFSSTIYFPGIPNIMKELHAPAMATTLTAALFILFMGIAPVFWASFSDYYQMRRFMFIISMLIFSISSLGSAVMTNIWGLVVLRCVQALGASCGQSVGAGVIADCYPVEKRGAAFGKYFFGVFFGPLIGPILGGFLIMSKQSWRATFWFCFAFGMSVVLFNFFFLPETYRDNEKFDRIAAQRDKEKEEKESSESGTVSITVDNHSEQCDPEKEEKAAPIEQKPKKKQLNPIRAFFMLRHPFVLMSSLVSGVAFGAMFAVETIIPDLLESHYGFVSWQTGLSYLGAGVGNLCGAILNGLLSDRLLLRARAKRGGRERVEDRLALNLWPCGIILIPFGLLLFGWGIESGMTYWTAIVGFGIQNFGMNQIMTATSAYLVDAVPGEGASATAAANLVRMVFACVLTLVANPMVAALGPGWTTVLLAALTWASVVVLAILKIWGPKLRQRSGFQSPNEVRRTEEN